LAYERFSECVARGNTTPLVLNGMAWLLATSNDHQVRNPARAVELGTLAVAAAPGNPYVLDTLAEAYHRAGRLREAEQAINDACRLAPRGRYFELRRLKLVGGAQ
jgi:Flp pilus assembly protein TadD